MRFGTPRSPTPISRSDRSISRQKRSNTCWPSGLAFLAGARASGAGRGPCGARPSRSGPRPCRARRSRDRGRVRGPAPRSRRKGSMVCRRLGGRAGTIGRTYMRLHGLASTGGRTHCRRALQAGLAHARGNAKMETGSRMRRRRGERNRGLTRMAVIVGAGRLLPRPATRRAASGFSPISSKTTQHGYVVSRNRPRAGPGRVEQGPGADRARLAVDHRQLRRRGLSTTSARPGASSGRLHARRSSTSASSPSISTRTRRSSAIANYGLKDGKVFDFVSRTTPTGGARRELPPAGPLRRRRAAAANPFE